MPDPVAVNSMFGRIARRYDLANRLLSGGLDIRWRRRLVAAVQAAAPRDILDLATGSGDVAFALARVLPRVPIVGMDFCRPMLDEAELKKQQSGGAANVVFREGDALQLPLDDASYDAITIAFGFRNLADRSRGLAEMYRVLRPGGRVFILEFSQPYAAFRPFYYTYLRFVLPAMAGLITGEKKAYDYLSGSIASYPDFRTISADLQRAGLPTESVARLTLGTVALHVGLKPR